MPQEMLTNLNIMSWFVCVCVYEIYTSAYHTTTTKLYATCLCNLSGLETFLDICSQARYQPRRPPLW